MDSTRGSVLRRCELGLGLSMVALLVFVHGAVWRNAGALWRDEVSSVNLASTPSYAEMLENLYHDSFPALWCHVLRGWMALGGGASDAGLRFLGCLVGLGIVAALWWNARRFGTGVPLVSLLLLGFAPTAFRYGDGVRGYGLGTLLLLVMLGAIWSMIRDPSPRRVVAAGVASLLAVHSSFTNSPLMLAICIAGAAVCVRRRAGKTLCFLIAIGLVALVSMVPYLSVVAIHNEYSPALQTDVELPWIAQRFAETVRMGGLHKLGVWLVLAVLTLATCGRTLFRKGSDARAEDGDLALFAATVLVAGGVCFAAYMNALSVSTQPWYYLPMMALAAVTFDVAVAQLVAANRAARIARLAAVVVIGLASVGRVSTEISTRSTNVDVIADRLEALASEDDLVLVHPWYVGVTFQRYYTGVAPWMTVPDFGATRSQPYREFAQRMTEEQPIEDELARIRAVLEGGDRVWVAGALPPPWPAGKPRPLPPAPAGHVGWHEPSYTYDFAQRVSYALAELGLELEPVPLQQDGPVSVYELLPLFVTNGSR